ncbi:uncharacterized protein LOC112593776 [Melanaphis sacchari]|uniref:uncharacterized protein LOC112593776 n=1 Tax=Melanaphis sacchari TaxID=742174 RepID=UPI000DC13308|nr:uncharacterized protein LOC112593776 [Melanaphis sacchari]
MTVITWCQKKIRRAYAACKRIIDCRGRNVEIDHDQDNDNRVDLTETARERNPSAQLQAIGTLSPQRRRPDIQPIGMQRFADPEKVAAVFKACKELQVPIGTDNGSDPAKEICKNTAQSKLNKNNIDNADSQRQ